MGATKKVLTKKVLVLDKPKYFKKLKNRTQPNLSNHSIWSYALNTTCLQLAVGTSFKLTTFFVRTFYIRAFFVAPKDAPFFSL